MPFSIEFHARLHLYLSILFNFLFISVCVCLTLSENYHTNKTHTHSHSQSVPIWLCIWWFFFLSFFLSLRISFVLFYTFNRVHGCVLSSFVSFQWLPYLHFTFSIYTNLFTFSLRFILFWAQRWPFSTKCDGFGIAHACARAHLPLTLNDWAIATRIYTLDIHAVALAIQLNSLSRLHSYTQ